MRVPTDHPDTGLNHGRRLVWRARRDKTISKAADQMAHVIWLRVVARLTLLTLTA